MFKVGDRVEVVEETVGTVEGIGGRFLKVKYYDGVMRYTDQRHIKHAGAPATTARSTDPDTSKKAAIKAKRTPLRDQIFHTICGGHYEPRPQGWTGTELADLLKARLNSVTPRFAELSRGSNPKIKDSGMRRDGQIVWELTK